MNNRKQQSADTGNRATRGFTLFYAMLISSLLLAIGLAVLNITFKEFVLSSGARDSETAFYAANTALECALYWDYETRPFGYYGDGLAEGLAGYWRFEEDTDTQTQNILLDSSRSGITLEGTGFTWFPGEWIGQVLEFSGQQATADSVTALERGTSHSISAWVYIPSSTTSPMGILQLGTDGTSHTWSFTPAIVGGGKEGGGDTLSTFTVNLGGIQVTFDFSSYSDKWTNIIAVYDGATLTVYVGGSEVLSPQGVNFTFDNIVPFNLGMNSFSGKIDDVRIYDRVLTAEEVEAINQFQVLQAFVPPIKNGDAVMTCASVNINQSNWETEEILDPKEKWKTTFDITLDNGTYAKVEVIKGEATPTEIISRGYNTSDLNNPRALERAIFATY